MFGFLGAIRRSEIVCEDRRDRNVSARRHPRGARLERREERKRTSHEIKKLKYDKCQNCRSSRSAGAVAAFALGGRDPLQINFRATLAIFAGHNRP